MGGIITVILAARHPQVKRIALIAPALEMIALQSRWKRIQLAFSQLCFPDAVRVPWKRDPAYHFLYEGDPDDDAYLGAEYWQYMRAQEWIPSGPLHILLYQAFGWEPPIYCHLPMVMGKDGQKLSKRHEYGHPERCT